jgi:hypothetical protein
MFGKEMIKVCRWQSAERKGFDAPGTMICISAPPKPVGLLLCLDRSGPIKLRGCWGAELHCDTHGGGGEAARVYDFYDI